MKKNLLLLITMTLLLTGSVFGQWIQTSSVPTAQVRSISIDGSNILVGSMTGWAFGPSGGVYYSTNGGTTFTKTATTPNTRVWSVFLAGTRFLVGSDGGGIHLSTNNGASWTNPLPGAYVRAFASDGAGNLFAAGYPNGVWRSTDNGVNWSVLSTPSGNLLSIKVVGSNMFVGANGDGIYRSSNGTTWTHPLTASTNVWSFATIGSDIFANSTTGLYRSTDDGLSWTLVSNPGSSWQACPVVAVGSTLLVGTSDGVKRSTDLGATWTLVNTGLNVEVAGLAADNQYAYAGSGGYTLNGSFYRRPLSEMIVSSCVNPTIAGVIAGNQANCGSFNPPLITSESPASGETGTLEYKWQSSVTPFTAWIDIAGSNVASYDPGVITNTTIYKRLARVSCKGDWIGAAESNAVTMTINPSPAANAITGSGTLCAGTLAVPYSVTVDNSLTATYSWSYSGTGAILNATTGNSITIDFANNATSGTLTVAETNIATGCSTTNTLSITVNPIPAANSITGTGTLCAGTLAVPYSVTVDNSLTATYSWSYSGTGAILNATTGNSITIDFANNASSGTLTVAETNVATGCSTSNTLAITVNPLPSANAISGSATLCAGTLAVPYSVTVDNSLTATYSWSYSGTGAILNATTGNSITLDFANNATSGTLTVAETNIATGCSTTNTLSITVNPIPAANLITGTGTLCAGTLAVPYSVTVDNSLTATYSWSYSGTGAILNSTAGNSITIDFANNATSGTLTVAETNVATGCSTSNTLAITVNPLPATAGIISGPATVCINSTVLFSVVSISNATSYSWSVPTGMTIISGVNTNSITVSVNSTIFTGNITVLGVNGCGNGGLSPSFTVNSVTTPPQPGNITGPNNVCMGTSGVVYSIAPVLYAAGYSWTVPTGAIIESGQNTNSITVNFPVTAFSGKIQVFAYNVCGNGLTSPTMNVRVNDTPIAPSITYDAAKKKLTSNQPSNNQWYLNGVAIPGATGKNYTPVSSGIYTDIITKNGCSSPISNSIDVTLLAAALMINDTNEQLGTSLSVYPNPFSEKLRFEFVSPYAVNARIDLYDMAGRIVKTIFDQPIDGGVIYVAEYQPENIISGTYFYRVTMGLVIHNGIVMFNKK